MLLNTKNIVYSLNFKAKFIKQYLLRIIIRGLYLFSSCTASFPPSSSREALQRCTNAFHAPASLWVESRGQVIDWQCWNGGNHHVRRHQNTFPSQPSKFKMAELDLFHIFTLF